MSAPLILYVDDERGNRVVFEHSFNEEFNIRVVDSPIEAFEILKTEPVAVVVTDQRMPEMTGNELLMRVKQSHPDIIRIIITAYSDLDPILRAVNEGLVARYVIKPWKRDELVQILSWAVQTYTMGRHDSAIQLRLLETERLATLGSLAAAVLHDIKQPMVYLSMNSGFLESQLSRMEGLKTLVERHGAELEEQDRLGLMSLAVELPDVVEEIREGCRLILETSASVSRLLHRTSEDVPRITDPLTVIRYVLKVCKRPVENGRGRLTYDGPASLAPVRIGWAELAQVLINLVSNAGHALLEERKPGGEVVIAVSEANDELRFVVKDNGPGMSAEVLEMAGTPFFTRRTSGTGLGITQCKRLVEGAGGKLLIESEVGAGTTVVFTIPTESE